MPVLIGWLSLQSREAGGHLLEALKGGLVALGWKEGTQFVIEERWANSQLDRLPPLADELVALRPAIIVAFPGQPVIAVAKAAPRTPIVFATGDPIMAGLVRELAHPGGMITGLSNVVSDTTEKQLEFLIAIRPQLQRVGFLADATAVASSRTALAQAAHRSAVQFSVEEVYEEVARPEEIEPTILRLAKRGAQALIVIASPILVSERRRIINLAAGQRWPVIAWSSEWPKDGALLSYGADTTANLRRAAYYVDRILKGTKPGDLPIEQPVRLELIINLKSAKALGIVIPETLIARADEVIE
jgi:putative ABC transport system substrate-binding protein